MSGNLEIISAREKGQFPVSIGTSLALEGASGIYPERPENPAPFDTPPREIWINVRTLFRNLYGSLQTPEDRAKILPHELHVGLNEELSIIETVISKQTEGRSLTVYYGCDYTAISRMFTKALLKSPKTQNQQIYHSLEQTSLRLLFQEHGSQDLRHFDVSLTGQHPESWIITHLPLDLLSKSHFRELKLLESHTGILKGPPLWYTKLTNGKDLPMIPFGGFSLQVFGDGGHQFHPMPKTIRDEVLRLAEEFHWNATTTTDRMSLSIRSIKDPMTKTFLLSLL